VLAGELHRRQKISPTCNASMVFCDVLPAFTSVAERRRASLGRPGSGELLKTYGLRTSHRRLSGMQLAPVFLAMMWRYADGSLTFNFWYVSAVALLMVASGIWSLVAPESFRVFYFNLVRKLSRVPGQSAPLNMGWGWGSPTAIRVVGVVAIALAVGFMTWVVFFTVPGVAY